MFSPPHANKATHGPENIRYPLMGCPSIPCTQGKTGTSTPAGHLGPPPASGYTGTTRKHRAHSATNGNGPERTEQPDSPDPRFRETSKTETGNQKPTEAREWSAEAPRMEIYPVSGCPVFCVSLGSGEASGTEGAHEGATAPTAPHGSPRAPCPRCPRGRGPVWPGEACPRPAAPGPVRRGCRCAW